MPFTKNDKNINRDGKKRGLKNKNTKELKEFINDLLKDNYGAFIDHLNSLSSKDYVNTYVSLLKYNLPTLKATEIKEQKKNDFNNAENIQIEIIHKNQNDE